MLKRIMEHRFKAILLLATGISLVLSLPRSETQSVEIIRPSNLNDCDCLQATYALDHVSLSMTSELKDDEHGPGQNIVSIISLLRGDQQWQKLSELSIPEKYLHERQVEGIENMIIASAHNLLELLKRTPDLILDQLISAYDDMISNLHSQTYHLKFNHAITSIFYHSSIIHTAERLLQGVPLDQLCPPYQAYKHRGFFACKQEYEEYFYQFAMNSPLFDCTTKQCLEESLSHLSSSSWKADGMHGMERTKRSFPSLNETLKAFAKWKACGATDCKVTGCEDSKFDLGWNILGSDWGCCGDYPDCCYLAENTCLIHDAVCTCCTFTYFCVAEFCVPDPWCNS
ncbi:uncharacterized protein [Amphiura filiformis]|uniref:uncharacterized protein n=1 Tax=Amphiura filiformis TaxID=82378 RepID=UPI003B21A3DF